MPTYIQGYLATITIDTEDYHPYASNGTLALSTDPVEVTKLGQGARTYVPGLKDGTITASLHLATDFAAALAASWAKTVPVAFIFRPGKAAGPDGGSWAGDCIITDFSQDGAADGEWDVSLTCQVTGGAAYTPAA